ncbi:hypothetical protein G6549_25790 [Bacillus sp. MM2020_1]|nr:hypothetical protein [Bacillus sp. MM2020_1]
MGNLIEIVLMGHLKPMKDKTWKQPARFVLHKADERQNGETTSQICLS